MQTYGTAQTTGRLRSGPLAEIYSARLGADDSSGKAVKALRPPAGFDTQAQMRSAAARFLESAWAQSEAAQQTDAGWASVHDFGLQDGTAYLITDTYEASLDDLIAPGRQISARLLRAVVLKVVLGLESAERVLGRAHGNLKPSNVLIDFKPGDASALVRVGLCDPAPGSTLGRRAGSQRDRQDLGRLIVSLVTGLSSAEARAWPVPAGPEWARLGTGGEGWRTLATDLLNPDQTKNPSAWNEVHRRADLLVAPVVRKAKWPWTVAAALILITAGLTAYMIYPSNTERPATFDEIVQLARESRNWAGTAQGQLTDNSNTYRDIQTFVEANPEFAQTLEGRLYGDTYHPLQPNDLLEQDNRFYSHLLNDVDQHATRPSPETQETIDETIAFLENNRAAARRAKAALDAVLAAREDLEAYIEQLGTNGVDRPARHPDADQLMEHYSAFASSAFDDAQREALLAIMHLQEAGELLVQIETARRAAQDRASLNDPFVAALLEELEAELSRITNINPDGQPNHQALVDLGERAIRVEQITLTISDPTRVHYASFVDTHRDLYNHPDVRSILLDWEDKVLQPGLAHVPQDTPDPRSSLNATDRLDEMRGLIATLRNEHGDDENAKRRQENLDALAQDIRVQQDDYIWTNRQRVEIVTRAAQSALQLDDLKSRIEIDIQNASRDMAVEIPLLQGVTLLDMAAPAETTAHYFAALDGYLFSDSAAMKRAWELLRDRIIREVQRDASKPIVLQKKIQEAVLALREIDTHLPVELFNELLAADTTIALWSRDDTLARFNQQREDMIDQLAPGLDDALASGASGSFRDDSATVPGLDVARSHLDDWALQANTVLRGYHAINSYFAQYHAPDDLVARDPTGPAEIALSDLLHEERRRSTAANIAGDLVDTDVRFDLLINLYAAQPELNTHNDAILSALGAGPGDDMGQVLRQAAQDEAQDAEVRIGAALAALAHYTPTDVAQLTQLLGLREPYAQLVSAQENTLGQERVKTIQDRFDGRASLAWQNSFNSATDAPTAEALLTLSSNTQALPNREQLDPAGATLGAAVNQLTPISRANIYLDRYQSRASQLDADGLDDEAEDQAAATLAQELLDDLNTYLTEDPRIVRIRARLETAIRQYQEGGTQSLDNAGLGPQVEWLEALGIIVTQIDPNTGEVIIADTGTLADLRKYRFQFGENGATIDMAFRLVEPSDHDGLSPDAPPAYLSTSEVPVGFFLEVLNATQSQQAFVQAANLTLLSEGKSPLWEAIHDENEPAHAIAFFDWDDARWNIGRSVQAPWISRQSTEDAFRREASALGINEPVGLRHPMQVINISGATYFANLLGCRLPKLDEWKAAVLDSGGIDSCLRDANVRDQTWRVQQDYLAALELGSVKKIWTSANSYTGEYIFDPPTPLGAEALDGANEAADYDDGFVWPRAVVTDSSEFTDLVGNVAEWVLQEANDLDETGMLLPATRPEAVGFGVRQEQQWKDHNFLIIGGSALSCSQTCSHDRPVDVTVRFTNREFISEAKRYHGYCDVGFRLAFTVGQPRLMVTLTALLKDDFLPPNRSE